MFIKYSIRKHEPIVAVISLVQCDLLSLLIYCDVFFTCKYKFKNPFSHPFFEQIQMNVQVHLVITAAASTKLTLLYVNAILDTMEVLVTNVRVHVTSISFSKYTNFQTTLRGPLIFVNINIFSLKRSIILLTSVVKTFCFHVSFWSDFLNLSVFLGNSKKLIIQRLHLHYYN